VKLGELNWVNSNDQGRESTSVGRRRGRAVGMCDRTDWSHGFG
jgi:hypothetical protein